MWSAWYAFSDLAVLRARDAVPSPVELPKNPALTHCMSTMRLKIGKMSSRKLTRSAVSALASNGSHPSRDESYAVTRPATRPGP